MAANRTFDRILDQIKNSNLNFHLQISPFSAVISLKKSPVKDRSGTPILTPQANLPPSTVTEIAELASKNLQLEKDLFGLREDFAKCVDDHEDANNTIRSLENQLLMKQIKSETKAAVHFEQNEKNEVIENLTLEKEQLEKENRAYKSVIENQKLEIHDLAASNKKLGDISNNLNKVLSETKTKFKKEKKAIIKQHKDAIKYWKNELGEETRLKIKLEDQLLKTSRNYEPISPVVLLPSSTEDPVEQNLEETFCSICATSIVNYVPRYCLGEPFNPACEKCHDDDVSETDTADLALHHDMEIDDPKHPFTPKGFNHRPTTTFAKSSSSSSDCFHESPCIVRQPFPPPLPALTPLINEYSMYHVKMLSGELDWGSTCWYCMRIEYEKYGCESCVWIKCFGELHGYPDVHPSDYKKYSD